MTAGAFLNWGLRREFLTRWGRGAEDPQASQIEVVWLMQRGGYAAKVDER